MKRILVFFMSLAVTTAFAQDFYWKKQFGSGNADTGPAVASDNEGNVFLAVQFLTSTVVGDSSLTAVGAQDVAIVKMDVDGNFISAFQLGGFDNDRLYKIVTDDQGNVYAIGSSDGLDFDGNTYTSQGDEDILIAKWDNDLNPVWLKLGGSSLEDRGYELSVDGAGNLFFTGYIRSSALFDGVNVSHYGNTDIVLGKINASGSLSWIENEGGVTWDAGFALELIDDEHFVAGGEFIGAGTIDNLNLTSSTGGNDESWVAKFDTAGQAIWVNIATNTGFNSVQSLASDNAGNIYAAGYFEGTTDFDGDTTLVSQGSRDAYLVKYSAAGDFIWARAAGGVGFDMAYGLTSDGDGKLHLLGMFEQTLTITPSDMIVSNGQRDMMVISVSADGDLNWYAGVGGPGNDAGIGLSTDDEGRVYGCGNFESTMMIDGQSFTSNGGNDVFVAKISPCVFPDMSISTMVSQELCQEDELGVAVLNTEQDVLYTLYANGEEADSETQSLVELFLEVDGSDLELGSNAITFSGLGEGCADEALLDTTFLVEVHETPTSDFTHEVIAGESVFTDQSTSVDLITDWEWDIEGTEETTQNVTIALADGDYNVCLNVITEFGCENLFCQTISVITGIEEYGNESLNIRYDAFNELIRWDYNGNLTIELYDMSGRFVFGQDATNQINLSGLNSQMYVFRMLNEEGVVATGKLLK